jgi:hypothetical protein
MISKEKSIKTIRLIYYLIFTVGPKILFMFNYLELRYFIKNISKLRKHLIIFENFPINVNRMLS